MALAIFKKSEDKYDILDPYFGGIWEASRYEIQCFLNILREFQLQDIGKIDNLNVDRLIDKGYKLQTINEMIKFIKDEHIPTSTSFIAEAILNKLDQRELGIITAPLMIMEVNRTCNYNCPWCYLEHMKENKTSSLTLEEMENRIVDPMLKSGTKNWGITGGEPSLTLEKTLKLANLITSKTESQFKVKPEILLFTNGHQLVNNAMKYKEAGITDVQVSLSSPIPEQERKLRRAPANIDSYKEAVEGIKECKRIGLKVILNSVITCDVGYGSNIENIPLIYKIATDLDVDDLDINLACPSGQAKKNKILFNHKDYEDINAFTKIAATQLKDDLNFFPPVGDLEDNREMRCGAGMLEFYVDYEGYTFPCNNLIDDALKCSNTRVIDSEIDKIWDASNILENFRNYEVNNINSECGACTYKGFCVGSCFARIWHQYGKLDLKHKPNNCYKDLFMEGGEIDGSNKKAKQENVSCIL